MVGAWDMTRWLRGLEHRRRVRVRVRRAFTNRRFRPENGPVWYRLLIWSQRNVANMAASGATPLRPLD